jgi:hypothetical protein
MCRRRAAQHRAGSRRGARKSFRVYIFPSDFAHVNLTPTSLARAKTFVALGNNMPECNICKDAIGNKAHVFVWTCMHIFCISCMVQLKLSGSRMCCPMCKQDWCEELDELLYEQATKNRIPFHRPRQVNTERRRPELITRPQVPPLAMLCCQRQAFPEDRDFRMIWSPSWNGQTQSWTGGWDCLGCGKSIAASNPIITVLLEKGARLRSESVDCWQHSQMLCLDFTKKLCFGAAVLETLVATCHSG